MKIKTSALTGINLDWAVAKCEGREQALEKNKMGSLSFDAGIHPYMADLDKPWRFQGYSPSTDWKQGGPIIERNRIYVTPNSSNEGWRSYVLIGRGGIAWSYFGPTFLIAAMRCYVGSKLGDEIDIPEELV
jgi:hypothetical protein